MCLRPEEKGITIVATKLTHSARTLGCTAFAVLAGYAVTAAPASAGYLSGCTKPGVNLLASAGQAQGFGSM